MLYARDPHAARLNDGERSDQFCSVRREEIHQRRRKPRTGRCGKTDEDHASSLPHCRMHELTEVLVLSQQDALFGDGQLDDDLIASAAMRLDHGLDIVSRCP